jgi:hypothetical protein
MQVALKLTEKDVILQVVMMDTCHCTSECIWHIEYTYTT